MRFPAATPVETRHGRVPIEKIKVGDEVLARNMATGKLEYKKVVALTRPHQDHLLELKIEGERAAIEATPSHPFWVKRGSSAAAWVTAGKMQSGDEVLTEKGKWEKVTEDISLNKLATVYNFEVQDNHDYFVGTEGLLVHNAGPCTLFHGTDINSAFDIAENGINTQADSFYMTSSQEDAQMYAENNPAGGDPAMVSTTVPDSVLTDLQSAGNLEINDSGVYRFLPGAWSVLNELGFNLVPGW